MRFDRQNTLPTRLEHQGFSRCAQAGVPIARNDHGLTGGSVGFEIVGGRLRMAATAMTHAVQVGKSLITGTASSTTVGRKSQWNPINQLTNIIATTSMTASTGVQARGPIASCAPSAMMPT